jgi:hypothetical protein
MDKVKKLDPEASEMIKKMAIQRNQTLIER